MILLLRSWWGGSEPDDRWLRGAVIFASILLFLVFVEGPSHKASMFAEKRNLIILKNNAKTVEVHILQTGAVIQKIIMTDSAGNKKDVALGFGNEEPYRDGTSPYFGAIVGRVANRIANASFELDGHTYKLAANNGPNCLHGGVLGFSRVRWTVAEQGQNDNGQFVRFIYESPDGDEGFPGVVSASVTYTLSHSDSQLSVEMAATASAPTPINLAQHTYFNLAGHDSGDVLDHTLELPNADHWTPVNEVQIPTGEIVPVKGGPMDFTSQHRIGERIADVPGEEPKGYDHNYVLFGLGPEAKEKVHRGMAFEEPQLAAVLKDPGSGTGMRVFTNAPGVQFYSGNFLDGSLVGKNGAVYRRHGGLCLETQGFPNAINQPNFPSVVIHPGEQYRHIVEYHFFTI